MHIYCKKMIHGPSSVNILLCIWTSVDGIIAILGKSPWNYFFLTWNSICIYLLYIFKRYEPPFLFLNCSLTSADGTCLAQYTPNFPVPLWHYFLLLWWTCTNVLKTLVHCNVQSRNCRIYICITFRYSSFRASKMALHTQFTIIPFYTRVCEISTAHCGKNHLEHIINTLKKF